MSLVKRVVYVTDNAQYEGWAESYSDAETEWLQNYPNEECKVFTIGSVPESFRLRHWKRLVELFPKVSERELCYIAYLIDEVIQERLDEASTSDMD